MVNDLVGEIRRVSHNNKGRFEFSIKRSADFAGKFLTDELNIKEQ